MDKFPKVPVWRLLGTQIFCTQNFWGFQFGGLKERSLSLVLFVTSLVDELADQGFSGYPCFGLALGGCTRSEKLLPMFAPVKMLSLENRNLTAR